MSAELTLFDEELSWRHRLALWLRRQADHIARAVGFVLIFVLLSGLLVGSVVMAVRLATNPLPLSSNPTFLDLIFGSRVVILALRMALLFAAAYVILSAFNHMLEGTWIEKIAGVEVASKDLASAYDEAEDMITTLADENDRLSKELDRFRASEESQGS